MPVEELIKTLQAGNKSYMHSVHADAKHSGPKLPKQLLDQIMEWVTQEETAPGREVRCPTRPIPLRRGLWSPEVREVLASDWVKLWQRPAMIADYVGDIRGCSDGAAECDTEDSDCEVVIGYELWVAGQREKTLKALGAQVSATASRGIGTSLSET